MVGALRLERRAVSDRYTRAISSEYAAEAAGIDKAQAKKAVEAVFAGITEAAKAGNEVSLPSFGKFRVKDSPARQGRNPATGAAIEIAASRKLTFAPAKQVKDVLAG